MILTGYKYQRHVFFSSDFSQKDSRISSLLSLAPKSVLRSNRKGTETGPAGRTVGGDQVQPHTCKCRGGPGAEERLDLLIDKMWMKI